MLGHVGSLGLAGRYDCYESSREEEKEREKKKKEEEEEEIIIKRSKRKEENNGIRILEYRTTQNKIKKKIR